MQFVLHSLEEYLSDLGVRAVVDTALLMEVCDLEVEAPLAGTDGANPLQQFIEVVSAETLPLLQALVIHDKPLDEILAQNLGCPDAKLCGLSAVDPVADDDDRIQVVEFDLRATRGRLRFELYDIFV